MQIRKLILLLTLTRIRIRNQVFALIWIRIRDLKMMRIHADPDPQYVMVHSIANT